MTTKPHDALFRAAFERPADAAQLFRTLLPVDAIEAIDWDSIAPSPGSFIDDELRDRQTDLLFSVRLAGDDAYLYLLLEHQSTSIKDMPLRMLVYIVRIWERFRRECGAVPLPIVIPVLVCHAPRGWRAPTKLWELIRPDPDTIPSVSALVPNFAILVEDLAGVTDQALHHRVLAEFQKLALWALRCARTPEKWFENFDHWCDTFVKLRLAPNGMEAVRLLLLFIGLVTEEEIYQTIRERLTHHVPETKEIAMTHAERMEQQGLAKGLAKGLRKQLALKFGGVSQEQERRIDVASPEELELYLERVLTAADIESVFST